MKALEILNKYKNLCVGIYLGDDYSDGVDSYSKDIEECDEAIAELEALENRSCDNCKFKYVVDSMTTECQHNDSPINYVDLVCFRTFSCNVWESK